MRPIVIALGALGAATLSAAALWAALRWVGHPPTSAVPADAIVAFAGGVPDARIERAAALAGAGLAPLLIANLGSGPWPGRPGIERLCDRPDAGFERVCVAVATDTTAGEAVEFGRIARERGLRSLLVVTDDYHLRRARLRMRRCFDGRVSIAGTGATGTLAQRLHEIGGLLEAVLLERGCARPGA